MEKEKLYFGSIDDTFCRPLASHLADTKWDDCTEITLFEAVPDFDNPHFVFCGHFGECVEKIDCAKSQCSDFTSKSGRGVCQHRGKLYTHGEAVTFAVSREIDDDAWLFH